MNSDKRVRFACNRFWIYGMLLGGFLAWMAVSFIQEDAIGAGIGSGAVALGVIIIVLLMMPRGYRFDQKGITICYLFLPSERYLWRNIRSIEVFYERRGPATFRLEGRLEGKERFYMDGKIHKNRRTKRLLETYWDGTITGYFFEDLRKWWQKRKKKQQKEILQHRTDEVVPMEREVRAETRTTLALCDAQAAQLGLKLRIKFYYETEDMEEINSRPQGNYVYTALIELCRPGETNESKIVTTSAGLLHVRLGKAAYRGVKDADALRTLREELTQMLEEVRKIGFDVYCAAKKEEFYVRSDQQRICCRD